MLGPYLLGGGPGAWRGTPGGGNGGGEGDPGFPEPPIVIDVNGDVTIKGKVKAGSFGKFVYPLATIAAAKQYTFRAVANFSQLAKQGKLAMVGFGMKSGNDFHIAGLRGDGSTGTNEYIVHGTAPNGWNKETGHTTVDNGAAGAGTQHSAYYRLITSSDGATYTLQTSSDGEAYSTVEIGRTPSPFSNVSGVTSFGVALWFNNADAGLFSITITSFAETTAYSFLGALASKASDQTTANYTAGTTAFTLDSEEYDTSTIHDTGSNTDRFTVPSALNGKYAVFRANACYTLVAAGNYSGIWFTKDGSDTLLGGGRSLSAGVSSANFGHSIESAEILLTTGEVYRCIGFASENSITVEQEYLNFSVEITS